MDYRAKVLLLVLACLSLASRGAEATYGCMLGDGSGSNRGLPKYTVSFITNSGNHYVNAKQEGSTSGFGYNIEATSDADPNMPGEVARLPTHPLLLLAPYPG